MPGTKIGLDNPAFAGRIRTYARRSSYERRSVVTHSQLISDVRGAAMRHVAAAPKPPVKPRSSYKPAPSRLSRSQVIKRQTFASAPAPRPAPAHKNRSLRSTALMSLAGLLFVFGLGVGGLQLMTNDKVQAQVQAMTVDQSSNDVPDGVPAEAPPEPIDNYKVGARQPRMLRIAKLKVEARVVPLGVKANQELQTPSNIFDAGWYKGSALPGEDGAVLLDGHVHGPTKPGVFVGLKKLQADDTFTLERGDGKVFTYRVVKLQSYDKDNVDMGAAFSSIIPGKPGLNMITCDGSFDDAGHYDKRLIVFAVQE